MNAVPEMVWYKWRDTPSTRDWIVYHKGANSGSSPASYNLLLNTSDAQGSDGGPYFNSIAPTSTHLTLGKNDGTNYLTGKYIAMLFSSVAGISKVGYHTCDSGNTTLTMGFQPRFLLLKNITSGGTPWVVIDSLRGINPGVGVNTPTLNLSGNSAQSNYTWINSISSTGLVITAGQGTRFSNDGDSFIWYAHA